MHPVRAYSTATPEKKNNARLLLAFSFESAKFSLPLLLLVCHLHHSVPQSSLACLCGLDLFRLSSRRYMYVLYSFSLSSSPFIACSVHIHGLLGSYTHRHRDKHTHTCNSTRLCRRNVTQPIYIHCLVCLTHTHPPILFHPHVCTATPAGAVAPAAAAMPMPAAGVVTTEEEDEEAEGS